MTCKILNNLCPNSLHVTFTSRSHISAHETRNYRDIGIPKQFLQFSKRSFYYSAAKLRNEIPIQIWNSPTIFPLKITLKEYLPHYHLPQKACSLEEQN